MTLRVDRAGQGTGIEPMLIRPDGYVVWAGHADGLEPALTHWFGAGRGTGPRGLRVSRP